MTRTSGRIRIVGGSLRNSRLEVPDLPGLRPTPERVRETLFNWLAPVVAGAAGRASRSSLTQTEPATRPSRAQMSSQSSGSTDGATWMTAP